MSVPNIRENYTVTDKADGERRIMYVSKNGKIYLLNTNMKVLFTGAKTNNEKCYHSLLDGEIIFTTRTENISTYLPGLISTLKTRLIFVVSSMFIRTKKKIS